MTLTLLPEQQEFNMMQVIAKHAFDSGLYKSTGSNSAIFMILMTARELGIPPMLALNGGIWSFQGKVEISSRLMNILIRKAGHTLKIKEISKEKCVIFGKRNDNGDEMVVDFTAKEAEEADLLKKEVWKKYTTDMLYNRCMSRLSRRLFPDVIGMAYVEGELSDKEKINENNFPLAEAEYVEKSAKIVHDEPVIYKKTENLCLTNENLPEIRVISAENAENLQKLAYKLSETQKEKIYSWMSSFCKNKDFSDLPEAKFNDLLGCLTRAIKANEAMNEGN